MYDYVVLKHWVLLQYKMTEVFSSVRGQLAGGQLADGQLAGGFLEG